MDNVFIFGAGTSFDAKIPLLSGFVEVMWEIAKRKRIDNEKLSADDVKTFENFLKVVNELDNYHGRANFDDRNIEDILSILTFNQYEKTKISSDSLKWIVKAISRTIELKCIIRPFEEGKRIDGHEADIYKDFWRGVLEYFKKTGAAPIIITLNYDLVLERSLFQLFNSGTRGQSNPEFPIASFCIRYHYGNIDDSYRKIEYVRFQDGKLGHTTKKIESINNENDSRHMNVDILKLHGSLNFPKNKSIEKGSILESTDDPMIIPPVFDKRIEKNSNEVWTYALDGMRKAKNLIFVGYSLPKSDIYMQYFIRTAIGPNKDLNKVFIFDPIMSNLESKQARQYKSRYEMCFSPQMHKRMIYNMNNNNSGSNGTFSHFVKALQNWPDQILF